MVRNRIGGVQRDASDGATFERRNPADRRQVVSIAPESTATDVADAVAAAEHGLEQWRRTNPTRRAEVLTAAARALAARADITAHEMVIEEGKPLADARNEAGRTPKNLELYAGEAYRLTGATYPSDDTPLVYSTLDPVGVVAVITPWNFPLNMASRKIGPALAAGNAVVFKPSPMTPLMGERLAAAFDEAGLPAGVLNVVHGFGAGAHLVADTRVGAVTFTGSNAVGHKIHAAVGLGRRVQLELGGKNPVVVLADADLDAAADIVARSSFSLTGQACTGAGRILVAEEIYDELLARVCAKAEAYVVGPGDVDGVTMGPLVDEAAVAAMEAAVAGAVDQGARVATGGRRLTEGLLEHGCFYAPTVLADAEPFMALSCNEVFGPVIGMERIRDLGHALESANATPYGLSSGIVTRSLESAIKAVKGIKAGTVNVNEIPGYRLELSPFGGVKDSGLGIKEGVIEAIKFMTTVKTFSLPW
jgi:aldehyde dehydrogenase (NAD+)